MKELTLTFILKLFTLLLFAQKDPIAEFAKNKCTFKSDGSGKSLGIKINLSVPCSWSQKDGVRPHIVKNFGSPLPDSSAVNLTISITAVGSVVTKQKIKELLSEKELKSILIDGQKAISIKKTTIDRIECGEIVYKGTIERAGLTMYQSGIIYAIYYQDKLILLYYGVSSLNEEKLSTYSNKYLFLFRSLAAGTVLLNQWE